MTPDISGIEQAELRVLYAKARRTAGRTPVGHPNRLAGDELWCRVDGLMRTRGVTIRQVSDVLGVSWHAVKYALGRRGYRDLPPSLRGTEYRNAPVPVHTHCKRGHALQGDNLRVWSSGQRACRKCNAQRARDRYRARKLGRIAS